jgi:hypothetical protein
MVLARCCSLRFVLSDVVVGVCGQWVKWVKGAAAVERAPQTCVGLILLGRLGSAGAALTEDSDLGIILRLLMIDSEFHSHLYTQTRAKKHPRSNDNNFFENATNLSHVDDHGEQYYPYSCQ